jgi:hypothetical protein
MLRRTFTINLVLVERFADPSRVCNLDLLHKLGYDIFIFAFDRHYLDLCDTFSYGRHTVKHIRTARYHKRGLHLYRYSKVGLLRDTSHALLKTCLLPRKDQMKLLRFCLTNAKGLEGALRLYLDVMDFIAFIKDNKADLLYCYSAKGFNLIPFISELLNIRCEQQIDSSVQYFGEFGFELLAVIPYAYWLHTNNGLQFSVSSKDTKCLYYFSPNHEESCEKRSYVPITEYPIGKVGKFGSDVIGFPEALDTGKWIPPPYKAIYKNSTFRWDKDLCIICNKYSVEYVKKWSRFIALMSEKLECPGLKNLIRPKHSIVNYLSIDTLYSIIDMLHDRYQVVYNRPLPENIVADHQKEDYFRDFQMIREKFPDVIVMQDLQKGTALSYNQLQLHVFANCSRFISVLGGGSYLASYFGGTNIIYARAGWEVTCKAYRNWFHQFSGARIIQVNDYRELIETVSKEFL